MEDLLDKFVHEFQLPLENPVLVFSIILLIILLSPLILRKMNIPGIIVLIISGIIIGPYGFGLLEKSLFVDVFSTIGLMYIMFMAGLELDLNEFKANKNKSLLFGFFTFIIPLAIGYPVCYYLLGYDFNASFLTASMFATHTLVTYPIVSKLGISKNQAVAITVGGTILTDTAVLIILAVIIGSHNGGLSSDFWIKLAISLTLFSSFMFFVIPRIAKWFFRKLESEQHSHYIFVLSVVFLAAFLAEIAGVEPIIGAFVAGLALNKLIPHSSVLMNRIEFIGNSLFIPFFLISVGMIVDISVIMEGPMALIVAGTLSVVALTGKWLAALLTQLAFTYSTAQRQLIFGLSGAHAAATLAVILVGHREGIIDDNILNGTVILILITCIVATFVTERAAKQIVVETTEVDDEALAANAHEQILIPIANTINIERILSFAVLIKDKKSTFPLSILTVVPNNREAEKNIAKTKQSLTNLIKETVASENNVEIVATIDHNAASGIARTAREITADLILVGWPQKTGIIEKLIGDKMDSILANTDKTLLICDLENSLVGIKRMYLMVPPLSELEIGFGLWVTKLSKLSAELSLSIELVCNQETFDAIENYIKKNKLNFPMNFRLFEQWDNIKQATNEIVSTDLLVFISSRKGYVSHFNYLDRIPAKMEKNYPSLSKIIIYPQ